MSRAWSPGDIAKLNYIGWQHPLQDTLIEVLWIVHNQLAVVCLPLDRELLRGAEQWCLSPETLAPVSFLELLAKQAV